MEEKGDAESGKEDGVVQNKSSSWKDHFTIRRELLPMKFILFFVSGGMTAFMPYLTIHMRTVGITLQEIGLIYAFIPIPCFLGPLLSGMLADKLGNYKAVFLGNWILFPILSACHLFMDPVQTSSLTMSCNPEGTSLTWDSCHDCHSDYNNTIQNITLKNCMAQCESPPTICFNGVDNTTCDTFNSSDSNPIGKIPLVTLSADMMSVRHANECSETWSDLIYKGGVYQSMSCPSECPLECLVEGLPKCEDPDASARFWEYFLIREWAMFFMCAGLTMMEAIVLAAIKQTKGHYGKQRILAFMGNAIIPLISGVLVDYYSRGKDHTVFAPAFILGGICIGGACCVMFFINYEVDKPSRQFFKDAKQLLQNPEICIFLGVYLAQGILWGVLDTYLFLHLDDLGAPKFLIGLTFTVGMFAGLPFLFTADNIINTIGRQAIFVVAFIFYGIRFLGYSFITNPWHALWFEALEPLSHQVMRASAATYGTVLAPQGLLATLTGLAGAVHYSIGKAVGALLGGFMTGKLGHVLTFRIMGTTSIIMGLIYTILYFCFFKKVIIAEERKRAESSLKREKKASDIEGGTADEHMPFTSTSEDPVNKNLKTDTLLGCATETWVKNYVDTTADFVNKTSYLQKNINEDACMRKDLDDKSTEKSTESWVKNYIATSEDFTQENSNVESTKNSNTIEYIKENLDPQKKIDNEVSMKKDTTIPNESWVKNYVATIEDFAQENLNVDPNKIPNTTEYSKDNLDPQKGIDKDISIQKDLEAKITAQSNETWVKNYVATTENFTQENINVQKDKNKDLVNINDSNNVEKDKKSFSGDDMLEDSNILPIMPNFKTSSEQLCSAPDTENDIIQTSSLQTDQSLSNEANSQNEFGTFIGKTENDSVREDQSVLNSVNSQERGISEAPTEQSDSSNLVTFQNNEELEQIRNKADEANVVDKSFNNEDIKNSSPNLSDIRDLQEKDKNITGLGNEISSSREQALNESKNIKDIGDTESSADKRANEEENAKENSLRDYRNEEDLKDVDKNRNIDYSTQNVSKTKNELSAEETVEDKILTEEIEDLVNEIKDISTLVENDGEDNNIDTEKERKDIISNKTDVKNKSIEDIMELEGDNEILINSNERNLNKDLVHEFNKSSEFNLKKEIGKNINANSSECNASVINEKTNETCQDIETNTTKNNYSSITLMKEMKISHTMKYNEEQVNETNSNAVKESNENASKNEQFVASSGETETNTEMSKIKSTENKIDENEEFGKNLITKNNDTAMSTEKDYASNDNYNNKTISTHTEKYSEDLDSNNKNHSSINNEDYETETFSSVGKDRETDKSIDTEMIVSSTVTNVNAMGKSVTFNENENIVYKDIDTTTTLNNNEFIVAPDGSDVSLKSKTEILISKENIVSTMEEYVEEDKMKAFNNDENIVTSTVTDVDVDMKSETETLSENENIVSTTITSLDKKGESRTLNDIKIASPTVSDIDIKGEIENLSQHEAIVSPTIEFRDNESETKTLTDNVDEDKKTETKALTVNEINISSNVSEIDIKNEVDILNENENILPANGDHMDKENETQTVNDNEMIKTSAALVDVIGEKDILNKTNNIVATTVAYMGKETDSRSLNDNKMIETPAAVNVDVITETGNLNENEDIVSNTADYVGKAIESRSLKVDKNSEKSQSLLKGDITEPFPKYERLFISEPGDEINDIKSLSSISNTELTKDDKDNRIILSQNTNTNIKVDKRETNDQVELSYEKVSTNEDTEKNLCHEEIQNDIISNNEANEIQIEIQPEIVKKDNAKEFVEAPNKKELTVEHSEELQMSSETNNTDKIVDDYKDDYTHHSNENLTKNTTLKDQDTNNDNLSVHSKKGGLLESIEKTKTTESHNKHTENSIHIEKEYENVEIRKKENSKIGESEARRLTETEIEVQRICEEAEREIEELFSRSFSKDETNNDNVFVDNLTAGSDELINKSTEDIHDVSIRSKVSKVQSSEVNDKKGTENPTSRISSTIERNSGQIYEWYYQQQTKENKSNESPSLMNQKKNNDKEYDTKDNENNKADNNSDKLTEL